MSRYILFFVGLILFSCANRKPIRTIFDSKKAYVYDAFFITNNNDTLSKETIRLTTKRIKLTSCGDLKKIQQFYETDTLAILPDSISKALTTRKTCNVVEIKSRVSSDPFSQNQYTKTLIAPFPLVQIRALNNGHFWKEYRVFDLEHYDYFIGELESVYTSKGIISYEYKNIELDGCWSINSTATHSELGNSTLDFLFHEQNGFVEMKYNFYDGTRIDFYLKEIHNK